MAKWKKLRALTLDEIRTIGFIFGLGVVGFWVVSATMVAIFRPDQPSPAPNLGVIGIVGGLVLQQAFKKDGDNHGESMDERPRVVPPFLDGTAEPGDERPNRDDLDGDAPHVHRRALLGRRGRPWRRTAQLC